MLLLSGLGPAQHLQDVGVPVVRDMPAVGSNLHDHFNCYLSWRCSKPITLNDLENSLLRKAVAGVRYGLFRSGPMASNGIHCGLFTRTDPRLERPDLQINLLEWSVVERNRDRVVPHPFPGFTLSPVHLRPDGRGTVRLNTPDPLAPPAVLFDYLRTEYDMQAVMFGIRLCRKIADQPALRPYIVQELSPGLSITLGCRTRCVYTGERCVQSASDQFLCDGSWQQYRGRSALARARHRGLARGGRLHHAGSGRRQHQRADDHDRRKGGGDDSGRCSGGTGPPGGMTTKQRTEWQPSRTPTTSL